MKKFLIVIVIAFSSLNIFATTWAPLQPYTQYCEGGKIKIHSIPYDVYNGPFGKGETFVYLNNKLLYKVDKYFFNSSFTVGNGKYILSVDIDLPLTPAQGGGGLIVYKEGQYLARLEAGALCIGLREGILAPMRFLKVGEAVKKNTFGAYITGLLVYLPAGNEKTVKLDLSTMHTEQSSYSFNSLEGRNGLLPVTLTRTMHKVKYPSRFYLPKLKSGKTIESTMAKFLKMVAEEDGPYPSTLEIHIDKLLINRKGKCEAACLLIQVPASPGKGMQEVADKQLYEKVENWLKQQTFDTIWLPPGFPKYQYSGMMGFLTKNAS